MPRALDPTSRFPVVLDSDAEKEPQPTFYARHMSGREWKQILAANDAPAGLAGKLEATYSGLRLAIVDWENLRHPDGTEIPYRPADFENILDPGEADELLGKILMGNVPSGEDLKKSGRPSVSNSANSARSAGPGPTDAGMIRRNPGNGPGSSAPDATEPAANSATGPAGTS